MDSGNEYSLRLTIKFCGAFGTLALFLAGPAFVAWVHSMSYEECSEKFGPPLASTARRIAAKEFCSAAQWLASVMPRWVTMPGNNAPGREPPQAQSATQHRAPPYGQSATWPAHSTTQPLPLPWPTTAPAQSATKPPVALTTPLDLAGNPIKHDLRTVLPVPTGPTPLDLARSGTASGGRGVKIGETSLNLVAPSGQCELREDQPADAQIIEAVRYMTPRNDVFAMYADCRQLAG